MNKNEAIKILKEDIQDIYSIANRFEDTQKLHQIDIDLALSKVRNLYEFFLKFNSQEIYIYDNQHKEISTIIQEKKIEIKNPDVTIEESRKELKVEQEDLVEKTKIESKKEIKEEPELIIETPIKKEQIADVKHTANGNEIVADKFQSKRFVHDNITKNEAKNDVSSKMQSKPIKDINTAIGLNDKFIFIRELFSGDKDHYHETIQVLNNFDTFENALQFLQENFDWDKEDENFIRLTELVRRKYL